MASKLKNLKRLVYPDAEEETVTANRASYRQQQTAALRKTTFVIDSYDFVVPDGKSEGQVKDRSVMLEVFIREEDGPLLIPLDMIAFRPNQASHATMTFPNSGYTEEGDLILNGTIVFSYGQFTLRESLYTGYRVDTAPF